MSAVGTEIVLRSIAYGAQGATAVPVDVTHPLPVSFSGDPLSASNPLPTQAGAFIDVISVTPTVLNADALDAGDVAFDSAEVAGAVRVSAGKSLLQSLVVIDRDDQKAQLRLVFLGANTSLGTKDSAPDIDDTEALDVLGTIEVAAADYIDLGANSVATIRNIGLLLKPTTGTSVWVAAFTSGTPTYTTGGLRLKLGLIQG